MSTPANKVTDHEGHAIFLNGEGEFYTEGKGAEKALRDKTLNGLKKKINDRKRETGRSAASSTPAMILILDSRHRYARDDEHDEPPYEDQWVEGFFVSMNAQTGDVTILRKDAKQPETPGGSVYFFQATDADGIATAKRLLKVQRAAELAERKAKAAFTKALRAGRRITTSYGRDKLAAGLKIEQGLVAFLAGTPEGK